MYKIISLIIFKTFLAFISVAQKNHIPLETFFKTSDKTKFYLSPNGSYYSYISRYEKHRNLFIQNVKTDESIRVTSYIDQNISRYSWINDSLIVISIDNNGDENYHLWLYNINTLKNIDLTPYEKPQSNLIKVVGNSIITYMQYKDGVEGLYSIDVLNFVDEEFVLDHNNVARVILAIDNNGQRVIYYRKNEKDEFKLILKTNTEDQLLPQMFTANNNELYCFSNLNRDKFAAIIFNPETNRETKILYENKNYDVNDGFFYDESKNKLLYLTYIDWKMQYHFTDNETKKEFDVFFNKFKNSNISIVSKTKTNSYIIFVSSDRNPGEYYLYENGKWKIIGAVNPDIVQEELSEMKPVQYKNREGNIIHGYLVIPKNKELKNLPVIVSAHGGPWTRDEWGYNSSFQFLANRGYAIFYMDFRGSRGYGKKHYSSSFKAWDKMNNDILDGVNWLVNEGIADKNNIAIYGHSWGGYASNYGVVFHSDVYKCGITASGPSDLFTFYNLVTRRQKSLEAIVDILIGNPVTDSLYMQRSSPLRNIEKANSPLLIWQGKNDPRVPWQEAQQMADGLKKKGINAHLILKENEGHNISNEENRFEFYREMELFLKKHLTQ